MSIVLLSFITLIALSIAGIFLGKKTLGIFSGIVIALLILATGSFTVISAGHTGVQVTLGEVNPVPLTEGVHMVNPISSIKDVDVRLAKAELKNASAGTKDLQQVHTDIVVQFRLDPNQVPHIYKEFGLNVDEKVLGPGINEAFKSVTARFNSEELITKRDQVSAEILAHLQDKMRPFNITVNGVSLVNFAFNAEYQKAIEAKVTATQAKLKAEQDLQRIEVEAKSRIAEAMGEARAIQIQAEAISRNGGDNYVRLKEIEKWDGKMPETVVNSSSGMMLNLKK